MLQSEIGVVTVATEASSQEDAVWIGMRAARSKDYIALSVTDIRRVTDSKFIMEVCVSDGV